MTLDVHELIELTRRLCEPRTGVVAEGNAILFDRIAKEVPLEILAVPSGAEFNGWLVPNNWSVQTCEIHRDGELLFSGEKNALSVAYLSKSFEGKLSLSALRPHIVTNPALPSATMFHCQWQYRPWAADWAISVPYEVFQNWEEGEYEVVLRTFEKPGEMLVGVSEVLGASQETIVLNSNNCHPHMANDGFAGTAVLISLMKWLQTRDNHYSYRLVIGPEHLGSVFYLASLTPQERSLIIGCIFEEMPGTDGPLKAARTFNGNTTLDKAFSNVLKHAGLPYELVPWRQGAGNDETVWEAPGYEIPCIEITRCEKQWEPFVEYHSDADSWELMNPTRLSEMLESLKSVVEVIEGDVRMFRNFDGLPCLSNPRYDLYPKRPDPSIENEMNEDSEQWGRLVDSLFRYFDGKWTALDIAEKHDLPFKDVRAYLKLLADKDLVRLERAHLSGKGESGSLA